ncbi:MAG TPA: leucine--tRNA ligase [Acidimicrobiales bacterium]|nr:leucine--tRNA ligase [Acidimicrobiales bacterium]
MADPSPRGATTGVSAPADARAGAAEAPPHRYTATLAGRIETAWQDRWEREGTFFTPNPVGDLSTGFDKVADRPKLYVLDMFPYPSGAGLHVGHPLGYIGTDVYARYQRMNGRNVVHAMGYDAFGLPAEQYAVQTGQHPRATTEANIATMRRQLRRLGLGHDPRRSVTTIDERYYRWTQWIFLQIFNAWYDTAADRARPVGELVAELDAGVRQPGEGTNPYDRPWAQLSPTERRVVVDNHRLAYVHEAPVNWCPGLGTVLANEEVTAEGRSERGNFPVFKRPLRQWMMRITAYADRLIGDLDTLDWPEAIKLQQRNWIGRSEGAAVSFPTVTAEGEPGPAIEVFTTRPDTLFGATYVVLAPEHPLVEQLTAADWPPDVPEGWRDRWTGGHATPGEALAAYRRQAGARSDVERQAEGRQKTGVFLGSFAVNPANGQRIPVFAADYVLMGYGTGAIMAVPAQDERDWDFAEAFGLPIVRTVEPPEGWEGRAYVGDGPAINSANAEVDLDGLGVAEAKRRVVAWLEATGAGRGTVTTKLRDWLFSRQRFWGEPFPIVYDPDDGLPRALPESMLPVSLPHVDDYSPATFPDDDETSEPVPPLARAEDWVEVELDLGEGPKRYRRETNTMPQWAGSCWYELRYLDPTNDEAFVDPENERYWMGPQFPGDCGGVDLYVGGAEHAVLHLLYARFWHKVLHDLGHVSSFEPYRRLFNQGMIQAAAYTDARGLYVDAAAVEERDGGFWYEGRPVRREFGKMGKSLRNAVTPDDLYEAYGADTLRLYEMFTGPLDQSRPWDTKAVVGVYRLLQRVWRNVVDERTGTVTVSDDAPAVETLRLLHRTVDAVRGGMEALRFNVSIARITELNNHLTTRHPEGGVPRAVAEPLVLLLAPLAPHVAEELWSRLGHPDSLVDEPFPTADPALLVEDTVEIPVQVNGKVRTRVQVPAGADADAVEAAARRDPRVADLLAGTAIRRVVTVPGRLVNFVVG